MDENKFESMVSKNENSNFSKIEKREGLATSEVTSKEDFRDVMETIPEIFVDETDRESDMTFARFFYTPEIARYFKLSDGDKTIGFQLIRINQNKSKDTNVDTAMYVPYGGLMDDYRNLGIYEKAVRLNDKKMMEDLGKDHALGDYEDERVIDNNVYEGEDPEEVIKRVKGRQNFFKRTLNTYIINDPDVRYCRPASDDTSNIQAYDSLGFRFLNNDDPKWNNIFNKDKSAISRDAYEKFYLEIMQLDFGSVDKVPTKEELRGKYPAVDKFFKDMESHPDKKWFSIDTTETYKKETPNTEKEMRMLVNEIEDRY